MDYEVIIIGAGSMGMAAGFQLANKGVKVLLVDANDPPHTEGAHHGETRLIRHAYGEGDSYVPMALRAQELWRQLEKESGETLFLKTGVLNVGLPDSLFVQNVIDSAKKYSLPLEVLSAREVNQRWAGFQIPDGLIGCFENESGVLMNEKCVRAYRELAIQRGAELRTNTRIQSIETTDSHVTVRTSTETFRSEKLIVSAGKGTNAVLRHLDLQLPLQLVRKTFSWFHSDEPLYRTGQFPGFTFDLADGVYYGFPSVHGSGVKIGRHDGGRPVLPDETLPAFGAFPEDEQDVSEFAQRMFSQKMPHKQGKTCTYANTLDTDFIIDSLPGSEHILVACGFSGHGFKFASVVGEILSKMAAGKETGFDLSGFSISRMGV